MVVCTLIALHQVHPELPLIVAANRDELYARRSSPPRVLSESPLIVGGRDEEKGGTWLGLSQHGYFVGITNQRSFAPPDPRARSRGEVVLTALAQPSLRAAVDWLERLDGSAYNAFNLLLGDPRQLFVAYARKESPRIEVSELAPGIWTLPNDRLGSLEFPKIDRARELALPLATLPLPSLIPAAQAMLADHTLPARLPEGNAPPWLPSEMLAQLQALCVHTPAYGTRSASLLAFSPAGLVRYLHADGPPCVTPLVDQPALVTRLAAAT